MPSLGDAYINIIPKAQGISGKIEDMLGGGAAGGAAERAGVSLGKKLMGGLASLGIGAAIGKAFKDALEAGGNLQQSFGGLDTIYGEAAAGAKAYAKEAARAGISMNSYAEQAVSFGAALRQAYEGDTVAAMEAANLAILDMADNNAKMGTDLTSIQTAYQGFAKQNYTMLDNLKLGYGGTKDEMKRLLEEAEKLTGVKYDINNLGDVYAAIHAIQEELGLTGVAAQEAETTLTGSAGSMKASWENFLAALTTGEGLEEAMNGLVESAGNWAGNLAGMLTSLVEQLPTALTTLFDLAQTEAEALPEKIISLFENGLGLDTNLESLLTSAGNLVSTLVGGIADKLPLITSAAGDAVLKFTDKLVEEDMLGKIIAGGGKLVASLLTGTAQSIPQLVAAAGGLVAELVKGLIKALPDIGNAGVTLVGGIIDGIILGTVDLLVQVGALCSDIWNSIVNYDWGSVGKNIIEGTKQGWDNWKLNLVNAATNLGSSIKNSFKSFFRISSPSKLMADEVGKWIPAGIALGIDENTGAVDRAVLGMAEDMSADLRRYTAQGSAAGWSAGGLDGLADRLSERPVSVSVILTGDASKIFRVVKTQSSRYERETGHSAFEGGYA